MRDRSTRPRPERIVLEGRYCRLEPLDAERHAADLHAAYSQAPDGSDWTYL
ncbi:N-acetyltransferase, partial [Mycobacterium tuberculosis]|nr:N-acetyltransferase [Mycobacterium tuberculosis]